MLRRIFQLTLFDRLSITRSSNRDATHSGNAAVRRPRLNVDSSSRLPLPTSPERARRKPRTTNSRPSDPHLAAIWARLVEEWFPERLDLLEYEIQWSTRPQKRTLASCNPYRRQVWVARELNHAPYEEYLPALIYHEMCHAFLGLNVATSNGRRAWHGREFKALERRHPGIPVLNLWIKTRGWESAVRSDRARRAHARRTLETQRAAKRRTQTLRLR